MKRPTLFKICLFLIFLSVPCTVGCTPGQIPPKDTSVQDALTENNIFVHFNKKSGFYEDSFSLKLSCPVKGAEIYYTLDGSTPDRSSSLYKKPISVRARSHAKNVLSAEKNTSAGNDYIPKKAVAKGTVIRAIAYLPDGTSTVISSASYFIGIDREERYGTLPVISLMTDRENLYDYETGIYVLGKTYDDWLAEDPSRNHWEAWQKPANYTSSGKEWERPIFAEYLTFDGSPGFSQSMGVRIMGGASRNQTQKSLKLIAREEYGKKSLKYELIPGNLRSDDTDIVSKYKSFILRNGGNDADSARIRDPLFQTLARDCRFETQQSTPCVVFLNGEFWGIYSITEDYSDNYFENNYGIEKENIVLVKCGQIEDGEASDLALYHEMYRLITQFDMSIDAHYEAACAYLDMDSFADYCAFELYVGNQDSFFENNNWRMWRVRTADNATAWSDGKWRMVAYDTDFSSGIYNEGKNYRDDTISSRLYASSEQEAEQNRTYFAPIELFRSLCKNEHFRSLLLTSLCDMRNIVFEADRAVSLLEEMAVPYRLVMPETFARFGPSWITGQNTKDYFDAKIKEVRTYLNGRYSAFPNLLRTVFSLSAPNRLTLSVSDADHGRVQVNALCPDVSKQYHGIYFPELTVTLTALPEDGFRFVGWETDSALITAKTASVVSFCVTENITIKAVFEKK